MDQWAGFAFLYFYLNAKLKVFSNHHPPMWKIIALYAPILGATLISGALTVDEFHNWYDVVAGAIIGSVMAISAYRMVYASVWDFRFNHIPLTRHTPFAYGGGTPGAGGCESAVWTRKAGWGFGEALGGAPFDAAHRLRGAFGGASGLRGSREGPERHDHEHGMHGGGLAASGRDSHNDRSIVEDNRDSQGGGIFGGNSRHVHSETTPSRNTTSHPYNTADNSRYPDDMTEVPLTDLGTMRYGPGTHRGAHSANYEPVTTPGHKAGHLHGGHTHNPEPGYRHHQNQVAIGRRPVPPVKENYASGTMV